MKDEVDFLPTDKHWRILQIDTIILSVCVCDQTCPNYPKYKFISLQYLTKEVSDEIDFLYVDKHEGFLQINSMVLIDMVKHLQSSQNNKFAMSLQYLKQEVRDEVDFLCVDKDQSWFQHFGHPSFQQGNTVIIDGYNQTFSK